MNDELDTFSRREADLEKLAGLVGADQHREFVEREHSERVAVRVQHVVVGDSVLASARQDDGIHRHQYILTRAPSRPDAATGVGDGAGRLAVRAFEVSVLASCRAAVSNLLRVAAQTVVCTNVCTKVCTVGLYRPS